MIDTSEQLNSVERKVGSRTIPAGEARILTMTQVFPADLEDVWDACTNAERIPRWFMPVSGDLRLGGRYQLEGNAGGTIEQCDPPKSFTATWEFGGGTSWIELHLTAAGDGTRFQLDHIVPADDQTWDQYGPGAIGIGWDMAVMGLAGYLSGDGMAPADGPAWMQSADGLAFTRTSNEAWFSAAVTAGVDEKQARTAADATLAAYTAPPPQ